MSAIKNATFCDMCHGHHWPGQSCIDQEREPIMPEPCEHVPQEFEDFTRCRSCGVILLDHRGEP